MKILHLADVHLGMENYGRIDPTTGLHTRLQDFIKCFRFAIDVALEEKVDLVLFAGDAYKNSFPNPTHQREFARQIYRLSSAQIPVVLVNGNHDNPVSFGKATSLEIFNTLNIPGVKVVAKPELFNIETKSGEIQIFALPWPTKSQYLVKEEYKNFTDKEITEEIQKRVSKKICEFARKIIPGIPSVFVAHLAAAEATYSGSESSAIIGRDPVFATNILAQDVFDYVALGHIHKFQDLNPQNHPPVVYSGSIERMNFGEEKEDKGFCLVTFEKGKIDYEFIPVPAKRFVTIDIIIEEEQNPTETIIKEIEKYDLSGAVVRVFYRIPPEREELLDFKKINAALDSAFLVAAITKKSKSVEKRKRTEISEDLTMSEAMEKYIQSNPYLVNIGKELKNYARKLEEELEDNKHEP